MIPERDGKSHGKSKRLTPGNISKTILIGSGVPGIPGKSAVERQVRLPEMWQPSGIPVGKWTVSVRPMPLSSVSDGGDRPA